MTYYPQCPHGISYGSDCSSCRGDFIRDDMESYDARIRRSSERDEPKKKRGKKKDSGES